MMKKNSTDKKTERFSSMLTAVISLMFIGLSVVLVANTVKSITIAYQRMLLLEQAEDEVGALRLRNLELIQAKEEILGKDYVEKEARDRLYYVKEGEIMVVLPSTNSFETEEDVEADVKGVADEFRDKDLFEEWLDIIVVGI